MAVFDITFVIVTVSLVIQVVILLLLVYGYVMFRQLKFRQHGIIMSTAVIIQLVAVFAIMVPSFVFAVFPEYIVVQPSELVFFVSLSHEVTGGVALVLGVWFMAFWRFRRDFKGCFNRKKAMVATMLVWLAALTFGITLYTIFNWHILMG